MKLKSVDEVKAYFEGQREATRLWAWWENGEQRVGCGVVTLRRAMDDLDRYEKDVLELFDRGSIDVWGFETSIRGSR